MPIAVDAASPARASANAAAHPATTASFDAPSGCVLVACCGGDAAGTTISMSNSGAALSWQPIGRRNNADSGGLNGVAEAHYAVLDAARTGLTVTATLSSANDISAQLYIVTGADIASPLGGYAEGSSTATGSFTTAALTTQAAGSLGFWCANDFAAKGTPTSSDSTVSGYGLEPEISGGSGYRALAGGAGASETFNITSPGATASTWNYLLFEIKAGAAGSASVLAIPVPILQVP